LIRVEQGKGRKDRFVMLSAQLLEILREYWRTTHPKLPWLFPGRFPHRPITRAAVARACRRASEAAAMPKRVSAHTLRHSFATFAPRAARYDARQAVRPGAENRRLLEAVAEHGRGLPLARPLLPPSRGPPGAYFPRDTENGWRAFART
jgi:integrase